MKIPNPDNPIFVQRNRGKRDPLANIQSTWNADFTRHGGKVCPSARLVGQTSDNDDGDFQGLKAIAYYKKGTVGDGPYWGVGNWDGGVGGDNVWDATASGRYAQDALSSSPVTTFQQSDAVLFNGGLCVSDHDDDIARLTTTWDADWFTTRSGASALGDNPHPMEVINIGSPLLAVGDGVNMHTVTIGGVATMNRLVLDQKINMIRSGASRAYIFTGGTGGTSCKVYEWDGGDTVPTRNYQLNTAGVLSAVVIDDVLYILTYEMEIKVLSGGGFQTVATFPVFDSIKEIAGYDEAFDFVPVVQRGMCVLQDKILINISNALDVGNMAYESNFEFLENYPGGVWEFDPATGRLSHKYAYTYTLVTDGSIRCYGQWAVPTAGNEGQAYRVGAILPVTSNTRALHVSGVHFKATTATPEDVLYTDDEDKPTRMRLVTNEIYGKDNQSVQGTIALKYTPMKHADDRIILKYRSFERDPIAVDCTWTTTTTLTCNSANFPTIVNAQVGDEVFVLYGISAGTSMHITNISAPVAGVYTITVDEAIESTTSNGIVIRNWKKHASFNDMLTTGKEYSVPTNGASHIEWLIEVRANNPDSVIIEEITVL